MKMENSAFKKKCFQWFADFVARYLAIINSSINFLIYCLVPAILHNNINFMLSHHVVYLLVLGTCSNFAAKRALSTEQLFPIKLRLKSFLYLSCRAPRYRYCLSLMLKLFPILCENDLDKDFSSRSQ